MGHIVIDIEGTSHDDVRQYADNSSIIKELETEVYQNGFLAGYVFADMSLYHSEATSEKENDPYLQDVQKFVSQQYQEMLGQVEKTFKKVQKVWEVVQYSVKDVLVEEKLVNGTVWHEMDQIFMLLFNIYKQLSPMVEFKSINSTKEGTKAKDKELFSRVKTELSDLVRQSFVITRTESCYEIICLTKSLPTMSQHPIMFQENSNMEPFLLTYNRIKDLHSVHFSHISSVPLVLSSNILLTDDFQIPVQLPHPSS